MLPRMLPRFSFLILKEIQFEKRYFSQRVKKEENIWDCQESFIMNELLKNKVKTILIQDENKIHRQR